jgi:para-aminobenzoate synthetase/4-amino-4-deoxychorismate lyase
MNFSEIIKQVEANPYSAFFYTPSFYRKALSYLLLNPIEIIPVYKKEDLDYAFKLIQKFIKKGFYGYCILNYEAGYLFEKKLERFLTGIDKKLIQFVFFDEQGITEFKSSKILMNESSKGKYRISDFRLSKTESQFNEDINKIKTYIREGDTYQVNYTVKGRFKFSGSYSAFYKKLLFNQSAKYSAFISATDELIISLSPELFLRKIGKKILSQPMKGTSRRGLSQYSDTLIEKELQMSEKNRAENVMIVDLIRNDFGKICQYNSVKVPELFKTEKYESLFQMVSSVNGKLKKKTKMLDIIQSIFPCGSVTGAPKIRTMEIINEIEKEERNIYTGSIGLITPGEIKMNVAIRTLTINKNTREGVIGLGSGIVWDSDLKNEYEEVMLKSKFLTEPIDYFEIFETMRYENGTIKFLSEHLNRMKIAADYFLFRFNYKKIIKQIEASIADLNKDEIKKIKLSLNKWGNIKVEISYLPFINEQVSVIISQNKINTSDQFRYFKTSNRKLYDNEYLSCNSNGMDEVLFLNEKGELSEGSRTNLFLRKGDEWLTPPIQSGLLAGIYRKYFLVTNPNSSEKILKIEDLMQADELVLTNTIKGEIKVDKLFLNSTEFVEYN